MANSITHAALPYPIYNARFTLLIPYLASDGTPTDPTTPDTEISIDGAAFADCAEEVTTISGSNGQGYITLSGAEMKCSAAGLAAKVASGPKPTLGTIIPRNLPIVSSSTLSAGSAGGGTLGTILGFDVTGCFIRTTGGTGGGGTNGANNQARRIMTYNVLTGVFTVAPNFETTPDATTTYDILLPEGMTLGMLGALLPSLYRYTAVGGDATHIDLPAGANVGDGDTIELNNGSSAIVGTNGVDTSVIAPNIRVTLLQKWNKTNASAGVIAWVRKVGGAVPVIAALNASGTPKVSVAAILDKSLGVTGNPSDGTGYVDVIP